VDNQKNTFQNVEPLNLWGLLWLDSLNIAKPSTEYWGITLATADRLSKFFRVWDVLWICNKNLIILRTAPETCRYITSRNTKHQKWQHFEHFSTV